MATMLVDGSSEAGQAGAPLLPGASGYTGEEPLSAWSAACLRCFQGDSDEGLHAALAYFDASCCTTSAPSSEPVPAPTAAASSVLVAAGLLGPDGLALPLSPDQHAAYVKARNDARKEAHLYFRAAKRARLAQILSQRGSSERAVGEAATWAQHLAMCTALNTFVSKHRGSLGVHPFFKGLRGLLQRQIGEGDLWRWVFLEEVLTEAGDEGYMSDAVDVLSICCRRAGSIEDGLTESMAWELPVELSDARAGSLLRLLPSESQLEGSATGELLKTDVVRTNMRGTIDEKPPNVQARLHEWGCAVL